MNATTAPTRVPTSANSLVGIPRPAPRERDFGIGYGRSSGYATGRRYTTPSTAPRFFRFA